ncbi:MAG: hypothetical protein R3275_12815 [Saprospiraceae bacterium]|nr:hypothetical protein [Saprospiraceae bacterium]
MTWKGIILGFVFTEVFALIIFYLFRRYFKAQSKESGSSIITVIKGILERLILYSGILMGYPQILIAFGALKIGTRIQSKDHISNDYFLIGNLLSIGLVFCAILLGGYFQDILNVN